jgi:2-octaprenyl-6-methoxyphenol hydroxylase
MVANKHDIAIVGAGLTGRLLAIVLARQGLRCALVDAHPTGGPTHDGRTTALAYATVRIFERIGVWDELKADAGAINDILVTNGRPKDRFRAGGVTGGRLHFPSSLLAGSTGAPDDRPLGYILENRALRSVLSAAVERNPAIDTFFGHGVTEVLDDGFAAQLELSNGTRLAAQALIACDGKTSWIGTRFGFRTLTWDYGQKAIAFNVDHTEPHRGVAHEMFYPDGPFAILPMAGNRSSIVWTERQASADALISLDDHAFLREATRRIGTSLGRLSLASDRACYPLSFRLVPEPVQGRVALAGDAYHTIHPIAGQGFNLAAKDTAVLAHVLGEARIGGLDVGASDVLARYARWRRFDTAALALGTDGLQRLFSNDLAPLRWARGLGLGLANRVDVMRRFFMREAGADLGDLPPLMRPY